tara:strand:- start:145 stop:600 length:456 start_codon:yes stop_codon:yes gene_type:complete
MTKTTTDLSTISLKQLYMNGTFDSLGKLRVNQTGYPFVTLLKKNKTTGKTLAQNIYFSQESGKTILANFEPGNLIGQAIAGADVAETKNSDGETRYKICLPSEKSNYESKSSLESAFGIRAEEEGFNLKAFQQEFSEQTVTTVPSKEEIGG